MMRMPIFPITAASCLMFAGCGVVACCVLTAASAIHPAGLHVTAQLRDLALLAGVGIAAWCCAGATLFGMGLRLLL